MCSPKFSSSSFVRRDQPAIEYVDDSYAASPRGTKPLPSPIGSNPNDREGTSASWFSRLLTSFREGSAEAPHSKPKGKPFIVRTQLAHGGPMISIADVETISELYKAVAAAHGVRADELLFCTRDTPHPSMLALVGSELNDGDFLFAHVMGVQKEVTLLKSERLFGVTLTDGCGKTLVKRLLPKSVCSLAQPAVAIGDAIVAINGVSMLGKRHFEVAEILGSIPVGESVSLRLGSPLTLRDCALDGSVPNSEKVIRFGSNGVQLPEPAAVPNPVESEAINAEFSDDWDSLEAQLFEEPKATETDSPTEIGPSEETISALNKIFDEYLGMSDEELSLCVWDLGVGCEFEDFAERLNSVLPMFGFPAMMIERMAAVINLTETKNTEN